MKPEFAVVDQYRWDDGRVVVIDTAKARYQGRSWSALNELHRRKFENLVHLTHFDMKERVKVIYR